MIAAHNAIINDPLALLAEFEGVIQDKDKRLQLDRSCGFKELEAIQTHICEEDVIKILNLIYNPVIKGEYNPWELLKGIQKTQSMFDQNMKDHLRLVSALKESILAQKNIRDFHYSDRWLLRLWKLCWGLSLLL